MSEQVIQLNASKAGMDGLDLEGINKIINDTSKGSKFYEHKRKRQEQLAFKVDLMKEQLAGLTPDMIQKAEKQADELARQMEEKRDLSRYIVHIDMDCFFAAVEMRDNPALKEVPMAVGGSSMLSTSNYEARRFGIRAGMPGFIAKKLCPQLIIVPLNMKKYSAASKEVEAVIAEYEKESLCMSMDEGVFDLTRCLEERNKNAENKLSAPELVKEIREKVLEKTQLSCSAGIAANGFLAKVCSDIKKPNDQYFLDLKLEEIESFLKDFPIQKICGIGPVTGQMLKGIGIETCGDLWEKRGIVRHLFKPATASFLLAVSKGIGSSFFASESGSDDVRKSISVERTFGKANKDQLKQMCKDLSEELEKDMEKHECSGKTVTLKIKTTHFEVKTRARSLAEFTSKASVIYDNAWALYLSYEKEIPDLQLRLMGVRMSNLKFADDDEGEGGLKQQTLSQLLSKNMAKKEYPCPSCEKEFESMRLLEAHVDECLLNLETESGPGSSTPTPAEFYKASATCPVCNRNLRFRTEEELNSKLNAHIDECLNMPVLSKISVEETKSKYEAEAAASTSQAASSSSSSSVPVPSSASGVESSSPAPTTPQSSSSKRPHEDETPDDDNRASSSSNPPAKRPSSNFKKETTPKSRPGKVKPRPSSNKPKPVVCLPINAYFTPSQKPS